MGHIADEVAVPSSATSKDTVLQNGDVVMMQNGDVVIVRYVGAVSWAEEVYIGYEMSHAISSGCNGTGQDGKQYFCCKDKMGLFLPKTEVKKKIPSEHLLRKLHALLKDQEQSQTAQE